MTYDSRVENLFGQFKNMFRDGLTSEKLRNLIGERVTVVIKQMIAFGSKNTSIVIIKIRNK